MISTLHSLTQDSFHFGAVLLFAAADLRASISAVAGVINAISLLLFFGGMILSALLFMIGRTEYLKYGLVGAGVGAMAWTIISTFFSVGGATDPGIPVPTF